METNLFDFDENNQPKNSKNSQNKKRNLIFYIVSLSLVLILGIICFERRNKASNLKKAYNELYDGTLTLKKNAENVYSNNMENNKKLVKVFNEMKDYKTQFEKDEKELEELEDKEKELKKDKKKLTETSESIRSKVRDIKSQIEKNLQKLNEEKTRNVELGKKYLILKEQLEQEEE